MKHVQKIAAISLVLCLGPTGSIAQNELTNITQRQFCKILDDYRASYTEAMESNNQIKINSVIKSRSEELDSLMPGGDFQDWQFEFLKATSTSDGNANMCIATCDGQVILQTGTFIDATSEPLSSTIAYGSREYRAIAQLDINDLALVSGRIVKVASFQSSAKEFSYSAELVDKETDAALQECEEDLRTTLSSRSNTNQSSSDSREMEQKPQVFLFNLSYVSPIN